MTDARPQLSKAEIAFALRTLKGVSADLETENGYAVSAALISEMMADPAQRDQLLILLEQFENQHGSQSASGWLNDGAAFDRAEKTSVQDDLCLELPMGADEACLQSRSTFMSVQNFLKKYKEEVCASDPWMFDSPLVVQEKRALEYGCSITARDGPRYLTYDVYAWSQVLLLALQQLQSGASRRTPFLSRLAQVFHRYEPPEWEVEKCPINRHSLLVVLHHGDDCASIGFVGSGQSAYVMVSMNETTLTMNESFQNTKKFAARIADFFTDAPKSGHKAIQHLLKAL